MYFKYAKLKGKLLSTLHLNTYMDLCSNYKLDGSKPRNLEGIKWMEVFETKKAEAQTLKTEIEKTDREIDQMVYELYGLSEEEIGIVEGSV